MEMQEEYKIHTKVDGIIDFKRNASDTSRAVFEACMKSNRLCVAFSIVMYNPDMQVPDHEKWEIGTFMPQTEEIPQQFKLLLHQSFKYIAEQVTRIWTGRDVQPNGGRFLND